MSIDPAAAAWFGSACVALWLKGVTLSSIQVGARVKARAFARTEDAALVGLGPTPEPAVVALIAAAWLNEHESTPTFLSISAAYVLLGGHASPYCFAAVLFVAARVAQGVAQAKRLQPQRTIAYLAGVIATALVAAETGAASVRVLWP